MSVINKPSPEREGIIEDALWESPGKLRLLTYKDVRVNFTENDIRYFCWKHGIYQFPTVELITFLRSEMNLEIDIEIGAGAGHIGSHVGIKMTDSRLQEDPDVIKIYEDFKQPIIKYPETVYKMPALQAVKWFKPYSVLGCWVTETPTLLTGVDEEAMMKEIDQYIFVGNQLIHGNKPVLNDNEHYFARRITNWSGGNMLISRASSPENNAIWIVTKRTF